MVYRTVFDLAQNGYTQWDASAFGLIFVFFGAVMLVRPGLIPERVPWGPEGRSKSPMAWGLFCFGLLFSSGTLWVTYEKYQRLASRLPEHRYSIADGVVTDFQSGGSAGKHYESFTVGAKSFSYYGGSLGEFGFNQLAIHGGPMRNGLHVRISYWENTILRVEIAR